MKDFWKKTKETFAVGVAKTDEFISDKKIETDPEYIQRENSLNDLNEAVNHLHKNLEEMNGSIKRIGDLMQSIGDNFKKSISTTSPEFEEVSSKAQTTGTNIQQYTQKSFENNFPTQVLNPLNSLVKEIKDLKKKDDECKKAHILLNTAESDLTKSRNNKSANVPKHEKEVEERKEAYNKLHSEFITSVDDLIKRKGQVCNDSYLAAVAYMDELMQLARQQIQQNLPQCQFDQNNTKLPPIASQK